MEIKDDMLVMVGKSHIFKESVFCNLEKNKINDKQVAEKIYQFLSFNVSGSVFKELVKQFKRN